jgi:hypothetical protein
VESLLLVDRRNKIRRVEPDVAVTAALGLVLATDPRGTDRRQYARRRGDARSVSAMLAGERDDVVEMLVPRGVRGRKSALFACGCVVVDPAVQSDPLQVLECSTHAALQAQLRRRRTDRAE